MLSLPIKISMTYGSLGTLLYFIIQVRNKKGTHFPLTDLNKLRNKRILKTQRVAIATSPPSPL